MKFFLDYGGKRSILDDAYPVNRTDGSIDVPGGSMMLAVRREDIGAYVDDTGFFTPLQTNGPTGELRTIGAEVLIADSNDTAISGAADTTIIPGPGPGFALRIRYVHVTNTSATTTQIMFRDGVSGRRRYRTPLGQIGIFVHNLKPDYWTLAENSPLVLTTDAAGNIFWTVEYKVVPLKKGA